MSMLNRKARRAKKNRRPFASDSPADQMKAFLKQPGKFHIVQLAGDKSFVVKVTEAEMPLFLTICQQLRGVLGHCEAIPATPVDASIADTQMIAEDSAQASKRIREARARQEGTAAEDALAASDPKYHRTSPTLHVVREKSADELAAMERHPAGKQRPAGGRHRAPEPETTFDKLAAGAGPVDDETRRRLASIEISAAQAEVARAQDAYEAANQRLREAYANGGELHNRAVLDKFAEQAGQAIAEQAEQTESDIPAKDIHGNVTPDATLPLCPHKTLHGPGPAGPWVCNQCGATVTQIADSSHRCDQPNAAPGDKWRCWCGKAWIAEALGELDIAWKPWPKLDRPKLDVEREAAIDAALRQAGRDPIKPLPRGDGPAFA
ncbi:hypothetical protein A5722_14735 [Mycobacterium vulneris]|nr:hypothetical protein A5722_14735 [Mycolicibacterium vulneris]OCB66185.1 hypothetical protein A5729_12240 [Mycolicibacterium vulneris]